MHETFTTVTVGAHDYRIGRLEASDGAALVGAMITSGQMSYLRTRAAVEALPASPAQVAPDEDEEKPEESPEDRCVAMVRMMMTSLPREDVRWVHKLCLGVVSRLQPMTGSDDVTPLAVLMDSGAWGLPDLRYDLSAILALVSAVLVFNLTPFFIAGGLTSIMATGRKS